jgi:hypothetical protein
VGARNKKQERKCFWAQIGFSFPVKTKTGEKIVQFALSTYITIEISKRLQ